MAFLHITELQVAMGAPICRRLKLIILRQDSDFQEGEQENSAGFSVFERDSGGMRNVLEKAIIRGRQPPDDARLSRACCIIRGFTPHAPLFASQRRSLPAQQEITQEGVMKLEKGADNSCCMA